MDEKSKFVSAFMLQVVKKHLNQLGSIHWHKKHLNQLLGARVKVGGQHKKWWNWFLLCLCHPNHRCFICPQMTNLYLIRGWISKLWTQAWMVDCWCITCAAL